MDGMTKTQKRKWYDMTVMPQNFFKHANKDPDHIAEFATEVTEYMMYDALRCFEDIYGCLSPVMRVFAARFIFTYRDVLAPFPMGEESVCESFPESEFISLSRGEFFRLGLKSIGALRN